MLEVDPSRVLLRRPMPDDLTDPSNAHGQADIVAELRRDADFEDIAGLLQQCNEQDISVLPSGGRSSVTRAVIPNGGLVLDMKNLQRIEIVADEARVQPGVSLLDLENELRPDKFFPAAPTWKLATATGTLTCHGNGALGYKYGPIENWTKSVTLIKPNGEIIEGLDIPALSIDGPALPKVSAGYNIKHPVLGSEGTLGVIADARLIIKEQPPTYMAMVQCDSDERALELMGILRGQEPEKRDTLEPGGIAAVEYIGERAMNLIRQKEKVRQFAGAKALLLVQVEGYESLELFIKNCSVAGADDVIGAEPEDSKRKQAFTDIRELVPETVNALVAANGVTKAAADPCVQPHEIQEMIAIFTEGFEEARVEHAFWGHGEGNIHFNAIPKTVAEAERAQAVILSQGKRIIAMGGTPLAEHGVGKNAVKQELLKEFRGEEGIAKMRHLKASFDPNGIMAPGNIFPITVM
jgi:D-lactate dehydrogenase (cytochrome)